MARPYRMRKRADDSDRTREKIIRATMALHDEKGVAPTTFADIARRAGVGQATMYRYFPTIGDLVATCGGHVWMEMRPPTPDGAGAVFGGLSSRRERLERLVGELDAFYERGAHRLALAGRDRELLPQLEGFLSAVEAGVDALVREAMAGSEASDRTLRLLVALTRFAVWAEMRKMDLPPAERRTVTLRLLECAIRSGQES